MSTDSPPDHIDQKAYYDKCVAWLTAKGRWAAQFAMLEDGFDPTVDYKSMYEGWIGNVE